MYERSKYMTKYNRGQHCTYLLTYHLVFVVKYRKPVISEEISAFLKQHASYMAERFKGELLSAETDRDHMHLLVSLPPNTNLSVFVRSIKTQLSKEVRARFPEEVGKYLYGKDTPFWTESYFAATTGTSSMEKAIEYIESQKTEKHQEKYKKRTPK